MKLSHKNTFQTVWRVTARHPNHNNYYCIHSIWFDDGCISRNYIRFNERPFISFSFWSGLFSVLIVTRRLLRFMSKRTRKINDKWSSHQIAYGSDSCEVKTARWTIYNCDLSSALNLWAFTSVVCPRCKGILNAQQSIMLQAKTEKRLVCTAKWTNIFLKLILYSLFSSFERLLLFVCNSLFVLRYTERATSTHQLCTTTLSYSDMLAYAHTREFRWIFFSATCVVCSLYSVQCCIHILLTINTNV